MSGFSPTSLNEIGTLEPALAKVLLRARAWSKVPFEVSDGGGARTIEKQREHYLAKRSKVNPDAYSTPEELYKAAKHVVGPGAPLSRAVDLFTPGQDGGSYDAQALAYLAGIMDAAATSLGVKIRWGGDFDRDGIIMEKGTFIDGPHFELDQ